MTDYNRNDLYRATLFIGPYTIVCDKMDGGAIMANGKKIRPGQTGKQVALGGPVSVDDITLTKNFDRKLDADFLRYMKSGVVGRQRCSVSKQVLDTDRNPDGDPWNYVGMLDGFTPGNYDSENSDADAYQIKVMTDDVA